MIAALQQQIVRFIDTNGLAADKKIPAWVKIVGQLEMVAVRMTNFYRRRIGDAKHFQGIIEYPGCDVTVWDPIDIHLTEGALKGVRAVVIGEMRYRDLKGDELAFVVSLLVQSGLQPLRGSVREEGV
jgi:hypothetical protein